MKAHRYANTETTDLWDAIEEATGEPVRRIMDSWIFQGGHPLVRVDLRADGRVLHLSQARFQYRADAADATRCAVPMRVLHELADGEVVTCTALPDGQPLAHDLHHAAPRAQAPTEGARCLQQVPPPPP